MGQNTKLKTQNKAEHFEMVIFNSKFEKGYQAHRIFYSIPLFW